MRGSYSGHGVRIFKDAVSLPDVSSQYLLSGTIQGLNALELYAPGIKAYEMMLKGAVVGGPSLDFIRKHGAGKTTIRSHKYKNARMCQQILGYDANALYPSTMLQEMPFGPEKVVHYENSAEEVDRSVSRLRRKRWFGFAELEIRVLRELWKKLEKFRLCFTTVLLQRRRFWSTRKSVWNEPSVLGYKTISFVGGSQGRRHCFTLRSWNGISTMALRSQRCIEPSTTPERKPLPGS